MYFHREPGFGGNIVSHCWRGYTYRSSHFGNDFVPKIFCLNSKSHEQWRKASQVTKCSKYNLMFNFNAKMQYLVLYGKSHCYYDLFIVVMPHRKLWQPLGPQQPRGHMRPRQPVLRLSNPMVPYSIMKNGRLMKTWLILEVFWESPNKSNQPILPITKW